MAQQTAVEWLIEQIKFSNKETYNDLYEQFEQAKQLEKQQSLDLIELSSQLTGVATVDDEISKMTYVDVYNRYYVSNTEQYYNETYGSKGSDGN